MAELNEKDRVAALDCMLKIMNHQLDRIKTTNNEIGEQQTKYTEELDKFDQKLNLKENKIFKDYHEARIKRKRMRIEEGIYDFGEEMYDEEIDPDELDAHADLQMYANELKKRQNNYQLVDIAETVVENRLLIEKVDQLLGEKTTRESEY